MSRDGSQRKREALREQGALHAHPDRVVDPLFEDGGFFDPQDVVQVKYEMLRRVGQEGMSVSEAASAFGFSRPSLYKARADFEVSRRTVARDLDFLRDVEHAVGREQPVGHQGMDVAIVAATSILP